jgi:hypothetical protein
MPADPTNRNFAARHITRAWDSRPPQFDWVYQRLDSFKAFG